MKITFYGVRGSIPVSDAKMVKVGGNTACVHLQLDDGTNLIFDAGTGIRRLGRELSDSDEPIHILLSHSHWDPNSNYYEWVAFCRHVDLLIHDAQAKTPVLFHQDPDRTDAKLESIQEETQSFLCENGANIGCLCAAEGLSVSILADGKVEKRYNTFGCRFV